MDICRKRGKVFVFWITSLGCRLHTQYTPSVDSPDH